MGTPDVSEAWVIQFKTSNPDNKWVNSVAYPETYYYKVEAEAALHLRGHSYSLRYRVVPKFKPVVVNEKKVDRKITNKPQLSQLPYDGMVYASKGFEFGCAPWKYERGNYLIPTPDLLAAFDRLALYMDASMRHTAKAALSMNRARGCTDKSDAALKAGAYAMDPESGLPHLCGAVTSLLMAIQQAVDAGLLPAELGQPWIGREPKASNEKI